MKKDKFIECLLYYAENIGDINNIRRDDTINFQGENIKIGSFMHTIRKTHKAFLAGSTDRGCTSELSLYRYKALEDLNIIWEPRKHSQEKKMKYDPVFDYVANYFIEHKTWEGIPRVVTIDGTKYNIRGYFHRLREQNRFYQQNPDLMEKDDLFLKRYKLLNPLGFNWEPKKIIPISDKTVEYLQEYYEEHKTLEGIPATVVYKGEKIKPKNFIYERRKKRNRFFRNPDEYQPSETEISRWKALEEMGYEFKTSEEQSIENIQNDIFIRYIKEHYKKYGTINNITSTDIVEFEGQALKIGNFIRDCRKKHYACVNPNIDAKSCKTPLWLSRYKILDQMGFDWRPSETSFSLTEYAKKHGVRVQTLRKNLQKFNGDLEKATKFTKLARKYDRQIKERSHCRKETMDTIMSEFEVDKDLLQSILNKKSLKSKQPSKRTKLNLTIDGKKPLREYCIENGLNYTVIERAIALKMNNLCDEDLQSLINRTLTHYNEHGQQRPSTWIYSKYGNEALVRHILLSLHLDAEAILRDMSKNSIPIETAMANNCFARNTTDKPEMKHLEPLYKEIINFINNFQTSRDYNREKLCNDIGILINQLSEEYFLTPSELDVINDSVKHYAQAITEYHLYNVGFEKNEDRRLNLILQYQLTDEEIEKAYYLPLRFDEKVLIGKNSVLFMRRLTIKSLSEKWPTYTQEERRQKIHTYGLDAEECHYVANADKEIKKTIGTVHQLTKK